MTTWLTGILEGGTIDGRTWLLAGSLMVITIVGSLAIALAVLLRLPSDFLRAGRQGPLTGARLTPGEWVALVLRNLVGALLLLVGIVLSVPGVPGQGAITVIAALLLLEFPGKQRLLRSVLLRPRVLRTINRLRARFSRPPLTVD
jgi:H+/Cl- antiporter ClcA